MLTHKTFYTTMHVTARALTIPEGGVFFVSVTPPENTPPLSLSLDPYTTHTFLLGPQLLIAAGYIL